MKMPIRLRGHHALLALVVAISLMIGYGGVSLASSEGGHGAETKGWIATDTYRVMNFTVLAVALFLLLRKPVSQALNDRIKGIKAQLEELEEKKVVAEKDLADYNKKLMALDQESEKIIEEYVRQGNDAKARILKEAESTAEKMEEQAKRNIEQEFQKAKINLQEDVLEKALAQAERIVKEAITVDDQERLVDEYLEKVVA